MVLLFAASFCVEHDASHTVVDRGPSESLIPSCAPLRTVFFANYFFLTDTLIVPPSTQVTLSLGSMACLLLSFVTIMIAVAMFYFAANPHQYALPVTILLPGSAEYEAEKEATRKRHMGHRAGSAPRANPRAVSLSELLFPCADRDPTLVEPSATGASLREEPHRSRVP